MLAKIWEQSSRGEKGRNIKWSRVSYTKPTLTKRNKRRTQSPKRKKNPQPNNNNKKKSQKRFCRSNSSLLKISSYSFTFVLDKTFYWYWILFSLVFVSFRPFFFFFCFGVFREIGIGVTKGECNRFGSSLRNSNLWCLSVFSFLLPLFLFSN